MMGGRREAEPLYLVHVRRMLSEPIVRVRLRFRKIELYGARGVIASWRRNQAWPYDHHYKHGHGGAAQNRQAESRWTLGICVCPCKERIESRDDERKAVDSSDCRKLDQRNIGGGRIAQEVPRKTDFREASACDFERNPEERRADTGERDAAQRKTVDCPSGRPVHGAPNRGNQQQNSASAGAREPAMHSENFGDPRDGRQHKT